MELPSEISFRSLYWERRHRRLDGKSGQRDVIAKLRAREEKRFARYVRAGIRLTILARLYALRSTIFRITSITRAISSLYFFAVSDERFPFLLRWGSSPSSSHSSLLLIFVLREHDMWSYIFQNHRVVSCVKKNTVKKRYCIRKLYTTQ